MSYINHKVVGKNILEIILCHQWNNGPCKKEVGKELGRRGGGSGGGGRKGRFEDRACTGESICHQITLSDMQCTTQKL